VLRRAGDLIRVDDAAGALGIDRITAAKLLARWNQQGWLKRLRRGLYAPVPLAARSGDQVLEDPWRLVPELFAPAYIGGASAAHHWDLTEQLFRSVFAFTGRPLRRRNQSIQGMPFVLRHVSPAKIFGTRSVWRGPVKVDVSDVHRTIVDMLDDPSCGGGIRHVADCLRTYFDRADASPETLVEYAKRLGNGAVLKRLGFLAERQGRDGSIASACAEGMTKGNVKLDPALPSPRLIRRWRLWVPESWKATDRD
jgi:predicted transcriptional regulator of viral defense system